MRGIGGRSRKYLVAMALPATLALALGPPSLANATTASSMGSVGGPPASTVIRYPAKTDIQIRAYWTPRRLRVAAAHPLPMPSARARPRVSRRPESEGEPLSAPGRPPHPGAAGQASPQALPGPNSRVWTQHGAMPATTIGKLFFTTPAGHPASCTATVITAPNKSTIWTAGHCVNSGPQKWNNNFIFYPDRHNGISPFGGWTWKKMSTPGGWTHLHLFTLDYSAIALNKNGTGGKM